MLTYKNITLDSSKQVIVTKVFYNGKLVICRKSNNSNESPDFFIPNLGLFHWKNGGTRMNNQKIRKKKYYKVRGLFAKILKVASIEKEVEESEAINLSWCRACNNGKYMRVVKPYKFHIKPGKTHIISTLEYYECDSCGEAKIPKHSCDKISKIIANDRD